MSKKGFNLLDEKWILAMRPDGKIDEVSLIEVFRRAHEFKRLAGELPTQDIAMLRLLLAILHAVFDRQDLDGKPMPIFAGKGMYVEPQDALDRWKTLWDLGHFPIGIIEKYLREYGERFDLIHPKKPFYQVTEIGEATYYSAAKLNGELSESNNENKIRLFLQRLNKKKEELTYNEAARWLLYLHAFDDSSGKPKGKNLPSTGVGWLGKLGLVIAVGDNLFETMMLNWILLQDGEDKLWSEGGPVWEAKEVKRDERTKIVMPANPAALLTLQSRRVELEISENSDSVTGYKLLGGDFFPEENSFLEQMTVWRNNPIKKADSGEKMPKRHDPSKQLWRDFSALFVQKDGNRLPGIVNWIKRLAEEDILDLLNVNFQTASVKYDDKSSSVHDVFSDTISLNAGILKQKGEDWIYRIVEEISTTALLVNHVGDLAQDLAKAAGHEDGDGDKSAAIEQAYFRLDNPFRNWLADIDPDNDNERKQEVCEEWWYTSRKIVRDIGQELISQVGQQAFVGRKIKEKNREHEYFAPKLYNKFMDSTASPDALKGGDRGK